MHPPIPAPITYIGNLRRFVKAIEIVVMSDTGATPVAPMAVAHKTHLSSIGSHRGQVIDASGRGKAPLECWASKEQ